MPRRIDPIGGLGRKVTSVCQRLSMLGPADRLSPSFSRLVNTWLSSSRISG